MASASSSSAAAKMGNGGDSEEKQLTLEELGSAVEEWDKKTLVKGDVW